MRYRSVIYVRWHATGRFEIFVNLGKLYSAYSDSELGVSRNTLAKKDLYSGYRNAAVEVFKCPLR